MIKGEDLKKGDRIVDFGTVYEITDIYQHTNPKGEEIKLIRFEPVFKNQQNDTISRTIPVQNVELTAKRLPLSKEELDEIIAFLEDEKDQPGLKVSHAKKALKANDPMRAARVLKRFWWVKHDEDINYTISKKNVFRRAMKQLSEEMAVVQNIKPETAKKKLISSLEKGTGYKQK